MNVNDYLARPYVRRLVPDPEGGYTATIQEFPGCVADGDTADEAMANLDSAAESWVLAQLANKQPIPEPIVVDGYSGKIALRLPRNLHRQVAELAVEEATSINQLLVGAIATYVGGKSALSVVTAKWAEGWPALQFHKTMSIFDVPIELANTEWKRIRSSEPFEIKGSTSHSDATRIIANRYWRIGVNDG